MKIIKKKKGIKITPEERSDKMLKILLSKELKYRMHVKVDKFLSRL